MTDAERQLHEALNVAIRRWGGHWVPACDGPDCPVCAVIATAFMARAEAAEAKLQALHRLVQSFRDSAEDCKARWHLEAWNERHACANELAATLTQSGARAEAAEARLQALQPVIQWMRDEADKYRLHLHMEAASALRTAADKLASLTQPGAAKESQ